MESVTYVNSAFNELGDSGSTVGTILKEKTGKTFKELMESGTNLSDIMLILNDAAAEQGIQFSELWSSAEAGKAGLSILTDEGKKFDSVLGDMQKSSGATAEAFETVSDTAQERLNKSINELKNSFLTMGEKMTPIIDAVSEGISKMADVIGDLDPEIAKNVVQFAALTAGIGVTLKVIGTFTSGIGGLVTGVGKGVKALANLITINSSTAAALSATGTATQGLTANTVAAAGGFGKFSKAIGLLTNPATLAVTAIVAIGTAIYGTQKAMQENQEEIDNMGSHYDDFTGRLRSNESVWTEIFGKKYSWQFSDKYKQALENSEKDVEAWVETLRGYQNDIQKILNDTSKTDEVKQKEMQELIGLQGYDTTYATLSESENFSSFLESMNYGQDAYQQYMRNFSSFISDLKEGINENNAEIEKIIEEDMTLYGEISEEGYKKIEEIQKDSADKRVLIESQNGEDVLQAMDIWNKQRQDEIEKYGADELATVRKYVEEKKTSDQDYYNKKRDLIKNDTILTQEQKNQELLALDEEMANKNNMLGFIESYYGQRALYDSDYAAANKMTTDEIIINNEHLGQVITDEQTGIQTMYFNTEESLRKYADVNGVQTTKIAGQNGEMVEVITDGCGNIIGSVNNVQTKYALFADDVKGSLDKYISAVNNGETTTDQAMNSIKSDLAQGKISAENFGMTDQEFLRVARAMLESKGDADQLTSAINNIPNSKYINISADSSQADEVISSVNRRLDSLSGRTITTYISTVTSGNQMAGGYIQTDQYASGGYVDNSEIAWTNESHRFELTDRPAYEIGTTSFGTLTALSGGTRVYNNTASVSMMKAAVQDEVARVVSGLSLGGYYNSSAPQAISLTGSLNPIVSQSSFDSSNMEKLMNNMLGVLTGILNKSNTVEINEKALCRKLAPGINRELGRL